MRKYYVSFMRKNKIKMIIISAFLLVTLMSFSAITGAKYVASFITVMEDFFSDGRKVLAAFAILLSVIVGIRALASQNSMAFMENIFSSLWILAIISVVTTVVVAVGGATLEKEYIQKSKSEIVQIKDRL